MIERDLHDLLTDLKRLNVSFEDKSVLVTGGAGFLGSWICDILVRQGATVKCIDNLVSGREENIQHLRDLSNFSFIQHDISEPISLDNKVDLVMHLASRASPFEFSRFPIQILKANTLGTWIALGIANKYKSRFLYASSSEIYGNPDSRSIPTSEIYNGNIDPVRPRSCYAEAKRAGEAFVTAYRMQVGLDTRIIRIFNTYGPRMRAGDIYGRVVPRFIDQALNNKPITIFGDGTQTRSFTYVTDQVEGILIAAQASCAMGEVINIGNDEETRIIDLANMIRELTSSRSLVEYHTLPQDDPHRRCPDIGKAMRLLNWKPKASLREGLEKTISWFRSTQLT